MLFFFALAVASAARAAAALEVVDTLLSSTELSAVGQTAVASPDGAGTFVYAVGAPGDSAVSSFSVASGAETLIAQGVAGASCIAAADVTADGFPELVVGGAEALYLLDNVGGVLTGGFTAYPVGGGDGVTDVGVVDLNSDGHADVLFTASAVSALLGPAFESNTSIADAVASQAAVALHLTPDRDALDVAVITDTDLLLYYQQPDGTFTLASTKTGVDASSLRAGDVDGDGDDDLVVSSPSDGGVLRWFENVIDVPVVLGPTTIVSPEEDDDVLLGLQLLDTDLDGDLDIAVASSPSGAIYVSENTDGAGAFAAPVTVSSLSGASSLQTADLDGDGDGDLVCGSSAAGSVQLMELQSVPFAPSGVEASAVSITGPVEVGSAEAAVTLSWSPPSSDNGAEVTLYSVSGSDGSEWTSNTTWIVADGLELGESCVFSVQAHSSRALRGAGGRPQRRRRPRPRRGVALRRHRWRIMTWAMAGPSTCSPTPSAAPSACGP